MGKHPRVKRNDLTVEQAWELVLEHWDHVTTVSRKMARIDRRIEPVELRGELCRDLVDNRELWDTARPYRAWVTSRCWGRRTAMLYKRKRAEQGTPTVRRTPAFLPNAEDSATPFEKWNAAPTEPGSFGDVERGEAFAQLQVLYERADSRTQELMLLALQGLRSRRRGELRSFDYQVAEIQRALREQGVLGTA